MHTYMYTYMCVCIYVYTYFRAYICVHVFKGTQLSDFGQIFEFSFNSLLIDPHPMYTSLFIGRCTWGGGHFSTQ